MKRIACTLLLATAACKTPQDPATSVVLEGETAAAVPLGVQWIHGSANCQQNQDPWIQVFAFDDDTFILRQNKCTSYEAPFMYLLFGMNRALLLDTGARKEQNIFPLRAEVDKLITAWALKKQQVEPELIVAHSHGHGDHTQGDGQFAGRRNTRLVKPGATNVTTAFGFSSWQGDAIPFDLGGRALEILPLPGHYSDHIAVYDPKAKLLMTGDSLYPGRLYIQDWGSYRTSIARLWAFAADKEIDYVLGAHIEMTAEKGVDYPTGTIYQPNEPTLELSKAHLQELNEALQAIGPTPTRQVHDEFIIDP